MSQKDISITYNFSADALTALTSMGDILNKTITPEIEKIKNNINDIYQKLLEIGSVKFDSSDSGLSEISSLVGIFGVLLPTQMKNIGKILSKMLPITTFTSFLSMGSKNLAFIAPLSSVPFLIEFFQNYMRRLAVSTALFPYLKCMQNCGVRV